MSNYFKMSEAGSIALHAMIMLSKNPNRLVRIREIADTFCVSEAHLAKVLNRLVRSGLIIGTRGPAGGYKLNKPAKEISLKEIYETIEGKLKENRCLFSITICDGTGCTIGDFFTKKSQQIEKKLSKTKLADIKLKRDFVTISL